MREWFKIFLLLFMFGLLIYFNSLNNKFLMDDYFFLGNPVLSGTKFISSQWDPYGERSRGVVDQPVTVSYYRPMAHIELDFCYAFFKNNYWQYHLFNIILFAFAASLFYLLIGKLSGDFNLAFLASLFYLIHPINGIVVNYISASVFALQAIFMIGTILLLWESLERKNDPLFYYLSLSFSFLSLFWNESGVMIPFYVSAVVLLFRDDPYKNKATYLFPYYLIVFSYLTFRFFFLPFNDLILRKASLFHMTGWEHWATLFRLIMWYIAQLFCPGGVVMQWATPVLHTHLWGDNLGMAALLFLFFLFFIIFSDRKICQLAIVWVFIGFMPVYFAAFRMLNVGALIEPHWFIFSSMGFFILVSYVLLIILDLWRNTGVVLLFIVFFAWGTAAHAYNQVWADQKTYARYWSRQVPNFKLAYFYLADAYQNEGAVKEAREYYRLALTGYTADLNIYHNLGMLDEKEGHWKEAESDFRRALSMNPFSAGTYDGLGDIYLKQGQWKKAEKCFQQALVYNPLSSESIAGLAYAYLNDSEYQKALDLCLKNLEIVDYDTNTLFLLVDIYMHKNDPANINKYAYRIIDHETDPKTLMKLGVVMARYNFNDIAIDAYIKTLKVAPDYADAYYEAGKLLERSGQYGKAIYIWKLGSSIAPSDRRFKMSIDRAMTLKVK
jgi:protein O-mannosyl-transferase